MTLIVRMTSKIADCGYYVSVIFGSLIWEGESSSSEPAHRYKATKGHSHKPSRGADLVSACQLIQHEQKNQHRKRIHQTCGWNAVFQSLIYLDVSGAFVLILTNLHPATACIFASTHIKSNMNYGLEVIWPLTSIIPAWEEEEGGGRRKGTELWGWDERG